MNEFKNFGLSEDIMKALDHVGFTKPTEIQKKAIPVLISEENIDFHGQAQTGTGKTLAFGIPLVHNVDTSKKSVQALIIAPTRELVLQIVESFSITAKFCKKLSIAPVYGGVDIQRQISQLKRGVHIVVGTPGRLNDLIRRKNLNLKDLDTLVLDEADIMLDMGFRQDIEEVLKRAPKNRAIWLFSATNKRGVDDLKKSHMNDVISVRVVKKNVANTNTEQSFCVVPMKYRFQVLCRLIDKEKSSFYGIIFCQTKLLCAEIASKLAKKGYNSASLHGDMDQKMRNKVIQRFKKKECDILVATDVAARGIDVDSLTHVINYSFPEDQESYVHRVGRTGRAGKKGTAITFLGNREVSRIKSLARRFGTDIKPLEIPSLQDLIDARVKAAVSYFNNSCDDSVKLSLKLNGALNPLRVTINEFSKEKLVDVAVNLLSDKFLKEYEHAQEIPDFSASDFSHMDRGRGFGSRGSFKRGGRRSDRGDRGDRSKFLDRRYDPNMVEVVLHVGSDDGIQKSDIINHCLKNKAVSRKDIERVRVIKRRSFVIVSSKLAKKVVSALHGKKIQGKKARVGLAKS